MKRKPCDPLDRLPRPLRETPPMIVNDISHLFFGKVRSEEPEGLMSQHGVRLLLSCLARQDGQRQSDLARATHLSPPTVSINLGRMEGEGLIRREAGTQDQRVVRVYLTDHGRQCDEEAHAFLRSLDDVLMQNFTPEETRQLTVYLNRMRDNLLRSMDMSLGEKKNCGPKVDPDEEEPV